MRQTALLTAMKIVLAAIPAANMLAISASACPTLDLASPLGGDPCDGRINVNAPIACDGPGSDSASDAGLHTRSVATASWTLRCAGTYYGVSYSHDARTLGGAACAGRCRETDLNGCTGTCGGYWADTHADWDGNPDSDASVMT